MLKSLSLLPLAFLFCVPYALNEPFKVYVQTDQFAPGAKTYFSSAIWFNDARTKGSSTLHFMTLCDSVNYSDIIATTYSGSGWMFIDNMLMLCNGNVFSPVWQSEPKRTVGTPYSQTMVEENVKFVFSDSAMACLKTSKSIAFRLEGKNFKKEVFFDSAQLVHVNTYYTYIDTVVARKTRVRAE